MGGRGFEQHNHFTADHRYCVAEVRHHVEHHKAATFRTRAITKTRAPVWNETHILEPWHIGEAVHFAVYDRGRFGSRVEGSVELPSEHIFPSGFEGELQLDSKVHTTLVVR